MSVEDTAEVGTFTLSVPVQRPRLVPDIVRRFVPMAASGRPNAPIICFLRSWPLISFHHRPGALDVRSSRADRPPAADPDRPGTGRRRRGENWPQWRGPGGQGISTDTQVPTEWAPDKNVIWKAELPGPGMSSPIVWGDRIYLTAVIEGDAVPGQRAVKHRQGKEEDWIHPDSVAADKKHIFKVVALDIETGKMLWERTAYEGPVYDARHRRSSFAGPTPVTDGTMVFAYFGPEGLYAYDAKGNAGVEGRGEVRRRSVSAPARRRCCTRISSSSSATRTTASTRRSWPTTRRPARKSGTRSVRSRSAGARRCSCRPAAAPSS